jgi:2-oxoglutarate ferredoxin oxidoreductase subunit alpha
MTPATSIALTVIKHADAMGVVAEQAEDEISAVNMALGASYAGAQSMVTTSGGGFALMVEGISLAGMIEVPLVCVVSQRPGPATGLPTRTEQADLEFVLNSGHGEFPRAIFSPGTVEDCFHATRKAFEVANAVQGPVFVLTDQFLADSFRAVVPFSGKDLEVVDRCVVKSDSPDYRRYEITESGISPRAIPGNGKALVVCDSDEHTEDGHLTEDLSVRVKMVEKRLRKSNEIKKMLMPPQLFGKSGADIMFVVWGSTFGAAAEACEKLNESGKNASVLYFPQVWPIVKETFFAELCSAVKVVSVEGNATAQFARLIRMETGFHIENRILRYDGLPITADYILKNL